MNRERNIWIFAGEASGDVYGAALARELRDLSPGIRISGMGGPAMIREKIDVKVDSTELGVMGVIEVMKLIFTFIRIYFQLVFAARRERPDAVVLIDYPGFNLMFALAMYWSKIPVIWYVCPHLWVWGKWRRPVLAKICRKMLVIFPFEPGVFAGTGLDAEFVGHPLLDILAARRDESIVRDPDLVLLLPGSRVMEITRLLDPMLATITELARKHPRLRFHLSAPREKIAALSRRMYEAFRAAHPDCPEVEIGCGDTSEYQQRAGTGFAASGTVTVECAIAGLPLVVGYKMNTVTLLLASLVVKLFRGFFTMVNIIADKCVFEEYLQFRFVPKNLVPALERILPGGSRRAEVEREMAEVKAALSPQSSSAARQADQDTLYRQRGSSLFQYPCYQYTSAKCNQ